jgi:uncharacterized membrane protein
MWFLILKWIHVLAAIIAVGANMTYSIWIARASREPKTLPFVLQTVSFIDRHVANPCYAVLLATGLAMALTVRIPLTTPWLLTAMILYVIAALTGIFAYAPLSRRQRRILETDGFQSPAYIAIARRGGLLGISVTLEVLMIVFLMVVKPPLWG